VTRAVVERVQLREGTLQYFLIATVSEDGLLSNSVETTLDIRDNCFVDDE